MLERNVERTGQTAMVLSTDGNGRESQDTFVGMALDKPAGVVKVTNMIVDSPTGPGVWRRIGLEINNCWELYPFEVAETIFSMYCDGGKYAEWVDDLGKPRKRKRDGHDNATDCGNTVATHRVYFETMKEIELSTGIEIDVSIIQAAISSLNYTSTENPMETGVWWNDNSGKWHCYGEQAVHDVRKAWRRRDRFVTLKKVVTSKYPLGVKYIINLTTMEQTNPITGRVRPIKIISNASMPPEVSSPYAGNNLTIFSLGMNLVRGSLQRLLGLEFINSIVAKTVLPPHQILGIEQSKHLKYDNTHLLYSKFRQAYETIIKRIPGCCGQLMRIRTYLQSSGEESLSGAAAASEKSSILRHVFYLAAPSEVENILETGLHGGGRHAKENFAFATDYYELNHKSWENSTYSLLLFLVLVPRSPKTSAGLLNAIPVASVEHQLPIAKLTLRIPESIELPAHESGQSGAPDSTCSAQNDRCRQVVCSTTVLRESVEITCPAADTATQRFLLPSKSDEYLLLIFKLYCPKHEELRYVGARDVKMAGRPTEILEWLREIAGLVPDTKIRLYKEDSEKLVDQNSTFGESQIERGSVIAYNRVLTSIERSGHRCPDFQAFGEHVRNRQVLRCRKLSNPEADIFSLELSSQNTYSDVVEQVAQYFGLNDSSKVKLTFNDCVLQWPKPRPFHSSSFSALLGNTYKQTTSILYVEILDCHPPELAGTAKLTIDFHGAKSEKLSAHEIELLKRSTVKDAVEQLRGMVSEQLRNPGHGEMRIFEVLGNRISRIHPENERIGHLCATEEASLKSSLRAVEIPEEDRGVGPKDRLIHVRHFRPRRRSRNCDFFGEPFLIVVRELENLAQLKERIKRRVQMIDEELLECKFALLTSYRREYLHADDLVARRMQEFSLGFYDPVVFFLGLEHLDRTKSSKGVDSNQTVYVSAKGALKQSINPLKSSQAKSIPKSNQVQSVPMSHVRNKTSPDHNEERKEVEFPQNQGPSSPEAEVRSPLMISETPTKSPPRHTKERVSTSDETLVLTVVGSPNQASSKCKLLEPMPLAVCTPSALAVISNTAPNREVTHITVPDPEFHNFDSARTEKDVVAGQVWAIYDNHDGMPRFYGRISQVSRLPFKVEFSWLEPHHRKKRWWVEVTGLSFTCGEYEISPASEFEKNIGVFSHLVLEKANAKGICEVYPRKGEVWAIFSNWDLLHMLGPMPILTQDGEFKQYYEYEIMQMLDDYSAEDGVPAVRLLKTKGFRTIFHPQEGPQGIKTLRFPDLRKFSHSIPAERMDKFSTGHLITLHPDAMELDPASLPSHLTVVDESAPETTGPVNPCSG